MRKIKTMYTKDQIMRAWRDAQIDPKIVEHHEQNVTDAMNRGIIIVPGVTFDCNETLMHEDSSLGENGYNLDLYNTGKTICRHPSIKREMAFASRKPNAPFFVADALDDTFATFKGSKIDHDKNLSPWWSFQKRQYEVNVDNLGLDTRFADSYATVLVPTWDAHIFRIPKPRP